MSADDDRKTPVPGRPSRDPNGNDRELLEFILDPESPDPKLLIRVVQKSYELSVDAINEVRDMRALIVDVSGTQRIIAQKLGIDLDAEKLRAFNEARSRPPAAGDKSAEKPAEPSVPPLREMARQIKDVRARADSFHDVDEQVLGQLAETTNRMEALDKEQAELKLRQAQQDKIVRSSIVRGIPKLLKYAAGAVGALIVIAGIAQQAWVNCSAGRGAPPPSRPQAPSPAESAKPR